MDDRDFEIRLASHLEEFYRRPVTRLARLQAWNPNVWRVDRDDSPTWVARVFPPDRPVERVEGDAEVLRLLEDHAFPAERCVREAPVSTFDGRGVLVTDYVEGANPGDTPRTQRGLGELLGRLATLPCDTGAAARQAGSWGGDPRHEGLPKEDIVGAIELLDEVDGRVPLEHVPRYDSLRRQLERVDDLAGLPEGLLHPDPPPVNAIERPDGIIVYVDWTAAGRGPRISSLGWLLSGASEGTRWNREKVDAVATGYCAHVRLEPDELVRLPDAMRIRGLYFASWYFRRAIIAGQPLSGPARDWCTDEEHVVGKAIAARVAEVQSAVASV